MVVFIFISLMLLTTASSRETKRLERGIGRLENKLDLIIRHLDIAEPLSPLDTKITQLIHVGEKIKAIKLYREETGASLKEAKAAVELIERRVV